MFTLILVIHVLVSLVIIAAVLLQAGKGASIGSTFGGSSSSSQTIFGSAGPATLLAKVTYGCAAIFMITSITLTYMSTRQRTESIMQDVPSATAPAPAAPAVPPSAPSTVPGAPVVPAK
ncbi:MAG: preprotein translocase subunit SecG [Deltaproteobacteria bacterium GWA2_54_12]|nr:MAG: preprotein translocase subunit SecG [Deltaproteobacteria bacterium GWA2_54_12]